MRLQQTISPSFTGTGKEPTRIRAKPYAGTRHPRNTGTPSHKRILLACTSQAKVCAKILSLLPVGFTLLPSKEFPKRKTVWQFSTTRDPVFQSTIEKLFTGLSVGRGRDTSWQKQTWGISTKKEGECPWTMKPLICGTAWQRQAATRKASLR